MFLLEILLMLACLAVRESKEIFKFNGKFVIHQNTTALLFTFETSIRPIGDDALFLVEFKTVDAFRILNQSCYNKDGKCDSVSCSCSYTDNIFRLQFIYNKTLQSVEPSKFKIEIRSADKATNIINKLALSRSFNGTDFGPLINKSESIFNHSIPETDKAVNGNWYHKVRTISAICISLTVIILIVFALCIRRKDLQQRISLTRNKIEKQILRQQLQQSFIKCILREEAENTKNYVMFCIHQEYLKKVNDTRKVIKTLILRLHQQQGLSEPSTTATAKPCNWHILFMHQGLLEPTTTAKAKSCNWHIFFMHQGLHTKKCKRKEKKSWCQHLKKELQDICYCQKEIIRLLSRRTWTRRRNLLNFSFIHFKYDQKGNMLINPYVIGYEIHEQADNHPLQKMILDVMGKHRTKNFTALYIELRFKFETLRFFYFMAKIALAVFLIIFRRWIFARVVIFEIQMHKLFFQRLTRTSNENPSYQYCS